MSIQSHIKRLSNFNISSCQKQHNTAEKVKKKDIDFKIEQVHCIAIHVNSEALLVSCSMEGKNRRENGSAAASGACHTAL